MLDGFDMMVIGILRGLSNPYDGLMDKNFLDFCKELRQPGAMQVWRKRVLEFVSQELRKVYRKPVVVLIDEYDSPMHSAIEHGYAALVRSFILLYPSSTHFTPGQRFLFCSIRFVAKGLSMPTPETLLIDIFS